MRGINVQAFAGSAVDPTLVHLAASEYQSVKIAPISYSELKIAIKRGCRNWLPFVFRRIRHS
jgi:hypothetical protein